MDQKQRNSLTCGAMTLGFIVGVIATCLTIIVASHVTFGLH